MAWRQSGIHTLQRKCTVERMQQRYKDGCDSSLPNSRCNNVTTSLVDATKETPCLQTRAGAKHTSTEAHHRIKDVISPHRLPHSGNRFTSSNYITRSFLVFFLANERERERERDRASWRLASMLLCPAQLYQPLVLPLFQDAKYWQLSLTSFKP